MISILIILILLAILGTTAFLVFKDKFKAGIVFLIMFTVLILFLTLSGLIPLILGIILCIAPIILRYRGNIKKMVIICGSVFLVFVLSSVLLRVYDSNRMPLIIKASSSYVMELNEGKNISNTNITLKKVFMDLNSFNASYSVRGSEKVVAVEVKKSIDDEKPVGKVTGLWVGDGLLGEGAGFGIGYSGSEFLDPLYVVFYLSSGDIVTFEVTDKAGVKDKVKSVSIDKTLDYNGSRIKFTRFNKGINYTSISFESDFSPSSLEISLTSGNKALPRGAYSWGSGGSGFQGSFSFDPVDSGNVQIKVLNKNLNREDIINIDLK